MYSVCSINIIFYEKESAILRSIAWYSLQSGGQSGVWTASVIILSIGTWVGRVGPRPADGELALLTSPRERLETVRQVLSEVPLIDGHNDLPWNIRNFVHNQLADFDFDKDLRQVAPWSKSAWSQTDLVRLRQGMVGGQVIAKLQPSKNERKCNRYSGCRHVRLQF